jgi:hypothetical protein
MILINEEDTGLGKPKWMKKIRLRSVSLKNAVKVAKFAAPIAAGFIPVGGGVISKVMNSKGGKLIKKVAKSKAVRKGVALSKTKLGRKVVGAVQNRARPQIEPVSSLVPASYTPMPIDTSGQNESSYDESSESIAMDQPVGELTPVKSVTAKPAQQATPKNNTLLYVLGAVALGGGIYYATKKD